MGDEDIGECLMELSEEVVLLHNNGEYCQCVSKLRLLQKQLMNTDRFHMPSSVLSQICGIIQGEVIRWNQEVTMMTLDNVRVITASLSCLKNAFPYCARNQLLVAESNELLNPIMSCTWWIFTAGEGRDIKVSVTEEAQAQNSPEQPGSTTAKTDTRGNTEEGLDWQEAHSDLALACVMCLGNMIAANSKARTIVWPHIFPILREVLSYREWRISQAAAMVLHNCLLESHLRTQLLRSEEIKSIVPQLLSLYVHESQYSCFVLMCLESVLGAEHVVPGCWDNLSGEQCLLTLDILSALVTTTLKPHSHPLTSSALTFLITTFKSEADKILRTHNEQAHVEDSRVLARLVSFVCSAAAADAWGPLLQQDPSLLITTVYLLRCMADIGKEGNNAFTPLSRMSDLHDEEQMSKAADHPAFGFKCDLIRLTASLVYRHKDNQDRVRDIGGVLLLMESSQFDARNPLIKEASIFALRNVLEGNVANQELIKSLTLQGVDDNPGLRELGMEAVVEGQQVKLVQRPASILEEEEHDDPQLD